MMLRYHVARGAVRVLPVLLSIAVSACPGYDPPHGDMIIENRSDQPILVYQLRADGVESLRAGPVAPDDDAVFFVLPRGQHCPEVSRFAIRDESGRELATRDMRVDPVCDGEPWVWHGDHPDRTEP